MTTTDNLATCLRVLISRVDDIHPYLQADELLALLEPTEPTPCTVLYPTNPPRPAKKPEPQWTNPPRPEKSAARGGDGSGAGSGGTGGTPTQADSTSTPASGATSVSDAASSANPAADLPPIPEWCETGVTVERVQLDFELYYLCKISPQGINAGLSALRAHRDYWRDQCRERDAQHARQMAEIERLTKDRDYWRDQCQRLRAELDRLNATR